jgi:hypothetical protein
VAGVVDALSSDVAFDDVMVGSVERWARLCAWQAQEQGATTEAA